MKKLNGNGIIGITGFAQSGKDTLCRALLERASCQSRRVALADELKKEMAPVIKDVFGKEIALLEGAEKEIYRPLMVAWGGVRRELTRGTHWTGLVADEILRIREAGGWAIVTDIRYADENYPHDEADWLKDNGGKLIHLKKYKLKSVGIDLDGRIKLRRVFTKAPNEQEKTNDKILIGKADFKIEWGEVGNSLSKLDKYVDDLVDYLNETQGIK